MSLSSYTDLDGIVSLPNLNINGNIRFTNQKEAISIGAQFAPTVIEKGADSIAIGNLSGELIQGERAIALGRAAGFSVQGESAIAVGATAGQVVQGKNSVAIGSAAGSVGLGEGSVVVGTNAGFSGFPNNSIALDATGNITFLQDASNAFYVRPVREKEGTSLLQYSLNGEISHSNTFSGDISFNGNVDISGNVDLNCNLINDVSGIFFCDGTYIGQGDSFDISANQELHITSNGNITIDPSNNNLILSTNTSSRVGIGYTDTLPLPSKLTVDDPFIGYRVPLNLRNSNLIQHPFKAVAQSFSVITDVSGVDNVMGDCGRIISTGLGWTYANYRENSFSIEAMKIGGLNLRSQFNGGIISFNTTNTNSGDSPPERMRIDASGNVGIGTTNPSSTLDVSGNVKISGNLDLNCNLINDVSNIFFCNSSNYLDTINDLSNNVNDLIITVADLSSNVADLSSNINDLSNNKYDKSGGLISGNVEISGNLDMSCNLINDVSGIYFCDGTYIGQGDSFDISANDVLVLSGVQDPSGAYNGASIVSKNRVYQQLNPDASWNAVNGYVGLAKDSYPALNSYSSGEKAVSTWTSRNTSGNNRQWLSITWAPELGLFAAVARSGTDRVMTSPDGITWTVRDTSGNNNSDWTSITWAPELGLFAAVAETGTDRVMTSPDGINWTARDTSGNDREWQSITWAPELGLFAAVARNGINNRVMTSPDGITWTTRTSAADRSWNSITWAPELGLFAAVGDAFGTNDNVMTSPDGINWTSRTTPASIIFWTSITWAPELGLFAAVASGNINVITSPDGITWTSRTTPAGFFWTSITWAPELGLFAATGAALGISRLVMTSPDGINWAQITLDFSSNWQSITWAPELGLFAAVANGSIDNSSPIRVMTSSLTGRPPTSYNVFDSSFNNIDNSGNWTIKAKEIYGDNLLLNGEVEISGNLTLAGDLTFENNGNNVMTFSDFSSNTQNTQLPSINNQPISLTRVSIFQNDSSYNVAGNGETIIPFGNIIKNQLNLSIDPITNIISPSLDISGQYVEIYANVEIQTDANDTGFSLDISGVDCSFFEIIDSVSITKKNKIFYLTLGPHMFLPEEWAGCSQFNFKLVDNVNSSFDVLATKIVFKSYYL
jgi:hypothetical protein